MKPRRAARNSATGTASAADTSSAMASILITGRADSTRRHACHEARSERLRERRDPVPAGHEDLAPVLLDRGDQPLGDELRLGDERAQAPAETLALRKARRLDEAGQDRMDADPARPQLARHRPRERELRVLGGRVGPG